MSKFKVKSICAWCGRLLKVVEFDWQPPGGVTHGICEECKQRLLEEVKNDAKS